MYSHSLAPPSRGGGRYFSITTILSITIISMLNIIINTRRLGSEDIMALPAEAQRGAL